MIKRTTSDLPDKYKTCDWLWNYGHIGLTEEHIKRLNNAINTLESLNEHTDVKYLKEIRDKLLEDITKIEKNADAFRFKPREDKMIDPYELKEYILRLMENRKKNNEKPHDDLYAVLGHVQILIEK